MFDGDAKAGGMMRTQIPKFRLPDTVIDEEVGYILDLGVEFRGGQRDRQHEGAARPKATTRCSSAAARRAAATSTSPAARRRRRNIHIGIDWLAVGVVRPRRRKIGKRVVVLGGGNTAMDCCRTARRLGGEDVRVVVRSGFDEMKASPWEKEDAMHEGIPILNYLVPKAFTHDGGKLTGVHVREGRAAVRREGPAASSCPPASPTCTFACDDVLVAVGQENAFPWIERDIGIEFDALGHAGASTRSRCSRRCPTCSSAATPRSARRTSSGRSRTATTPRSRSTATATARTSRERPPPHVNLMSQKMGIHEWSYDNAISPDRATRCR